MSNLYTIFTSDDREAVHRAGPSRWLDDWAAISRHKPSSECFREFKTYETARTPKEIKKEDDAIHQVHRWLGLTLKPTENGRPISRRVMNKLPLPYVSQLSYRGLLGRGKHGVVALFEDPKSKQLLALKFMEKVSSTCNNVPRVEYTMAKLFARHQLAGLSYWIWESDNAAVLCQEASERSLLEYLVCAFSEHEGRTRFLLLAWLVRELIRVYRTLHQEHLTHGDLHADNIRIRWGVTKQRRLRLIDFGKSRDGRSNVNYDMAQLVHSLKRFTEEVVKFRHPEIVPDLLAFVDDLTDVLQHVKDSMADVPALRLRDVNQKELAELYTQFCEDRKSWRPPVDEK